MKLSLIGYGKMGQIVHELALAHQHEIVSIIDPTHPQADDKEIHAQSVKNADLCIDFSTPNAALNNIEKLAELKKSMVIGTTGWKVDIAQLSQLAIDKRIGILYAPNFSIGVYLFSIIVEKLSFLIDPFKEYDIGLTEMHHHQKKDTPSGTALYLAQSILKNMERKKSTTIHAPKSSCELQLCSQRIGSVIGEHQVIVDSDFEQIILKHTCKTRKSFALGALKGALWLHSKVGFYSLDDMMKDLFEGSFLC